jgi:hypothetical protein
MGGHADVAELAVRAGGNARGQHHLPVSTWLVILLITISLAGLPFSIITTRSWSTGQVVCISIARRVVSPHAFENPTAPRLLANWKKYGLQTMAAVRSQATVVGWLGDEL